MTQVWEIVTTINTWSTCLSVKKNYFLLSAWDFCYLFIYFISFPLPLSFWHVQWYGGNSFSGLLQLEMTKQKLEEHFSCRNNWAGTMGGEEYYTCVEWWKVEPVWLLETILDVQSNCPTDRGSDVQDTDELLHVQSRVSRGTSFQFLSWLNRIREYFADL